MESKSILKYFLLVFVGASVAFLAVKEIRKSTKPLEASVSRAAAASPVVATTVTSTEAQPAMRPNRVVAYYFHGRVRCVSCKKIEALSGKAIRTGFAKELEDGRLEFRLVNVDEPQNQHFVVDYKLVGQSLVVVKYRDGWQVGWENLEKVWTLLDSEGKFIPYVQKGISGYLKEV